MVVTTMALHKPELPLSTVLYLNDHLQALRGNNNVDQDVAAFNGYNHLFETIGCTVCQSPHGYRIREAARSLTLCSPRCLAILVRNGLNPYVNVNLQPQPGQSGFEFSKTPARLETSAEAFSLSNNNLSWKDDGERHITKFVQTKPDSEFKTNTPGLSLFRMVRSAFAAEAEEESLSTTVVATSLNTEERIPSVLKVQDAEEQLERKWFVGDLKLSPIFSQPEGRYKIVYSWDPFRHLLQSADCGEEDIFDLLEKLQEYHANVAAKPLTELPEQNQLICAVFSGDGSLYRAVVLAVNVELQSVLVKFLDFGGDEHVMLANCFPICQKVMDEHPVYGLEFHLERPATYTAIPSLDEVNNMRELRKNLVVLETKEKLNEIVWKGRLLFEDGSSLVEKMLRKREAAGREVQAVVGDVQRASMAVEVEKTIKSSAPGILRQAFKKEVAKEALHQTLIPKSTKPSMLTKENVDKKQLECAFQEVRDKPTSKATSGTLMELVTLAVSQKGSSVPDAQKTATTSAQSTTPGLAPEVTLVPDSVPQRKKKTFSFNLMDHTRSLVDDAKVKILFAWTAGKLNIVAAADSEHLVALEDSVHSYAKSAPVLSEVPQVGTVVVGPYEEDGYYRGRVTSTDGDRVTVEFFDLGDSVTVPFTKCRQISAELFKVLVYGALLTVEGIPETLPSTEISDELLDKTWTLEIIDREDAFHWVGQLWDDEDVAFADRVLRKN